MKKILLTMFLSLLMLLFVSTTQTGEAKVKIIKPNSVTLNVGEKAKIKVKANMWKSSNKKVAVVSSKGIIRAKKAGKAKITAYRGKQKTVYNIKVIKKTTKKQVRQLTPEIPNPTGNMESTYTLASNKKTEPTENPKPISDDVKDVADVWLFFEIYEKKITRETTLLTGAVANKDYDTAIRVRVNNILIAEKRLINGEDTFSLEVDFSKFEAGSEVIVSREYIGDDISASTIGIWKQAQRFSIIQDYPVVADAWLLFGVDQEQITSQTTLLTGSISLKGYESAIRVYVNDKLIAEQYLNKGEETFSVEVDFSQCKTGDKITVSREYTGKRDNNSMLTIWDQSKWFTIN